MHGTGGSVQFLKAFYFQAVSFIDDRFRGSPPTRPVILALNASIMNL